ncbi:metallophosphoesterase [Kribbella sandramycini]|uniref:3',5'-cyclic AMP phosphodiesterase CpdA n=1 Tax=Kribbella sandramycini TaxID=60450 RepID=A0A7Y4KYD9_9ACTN|nr:metallophosphoesterase [Kribbella sandramycini]MBB6569226.1 3',5'-cyclic AMP phosphodiesterase CpdA [Kribbella sandramycini]NOL40933.1 metallophosphoesterase [Kribbella sandramycini]
MFVIAHLSDPHLDGTDVPRERLRRITAYLNAFQRPVDVVLVSGDLADHGLDSEYAELAAELPTGVPVLVLPGNHDVSEPLRKGLAEYLDSPGFDHPVHQVREVAGARFALVDTTVPGADHGLLSADSLDWLDATLGEPYDGPTFVAMHHPPLTMRHPIMDQWLLHAQDALERVLSGKSITAILTGHVHNAVVTSFAGHRVLGAPGIRSTVPLPFEPAVPSGIVDTEAHPGLALHVLYPDGPLQTFYRFP